MYRYTCTCSNPVCNHTSHKEEKEDVPVNLNKGYSMSIKSINTKDKTFQLIDNGKEEHLLAKKDSKYELHLHNNTDELTYVTVIVGSTELGTWTINPRTTLCLKKDKKTKDKLSFDSSFVHAADMVNLSDDVCVKSAITAAFLPGHYATMVCDSTCELSINWHSATIMKLPVTICDHSFNDTM